MQINLRVQVKTEDYLTIHEGVGTLVRISLAAGKVVKAPMPRTLFVVIETSFYCLLSLTGRHPSFSCRVRQLISHHRTANYSRATSGGAEQGKMMGTMALGEVGKYRRRSKESEPRNQCSGLRFGRMRKGLTRLCDQLKLVVVQRAEQRAAAVSVWQWITSSSRRNTTFPFWNQFWRLLDSREREVYVRASSTLCAGLLCTLVFSAVSLHCQFGLKRESINSPTSSTKGSREWPTSNAGVYLLSALASRTLQVCLKRWLQNSWKFRLIMLGTNAWNLLCSPPSPPPPHWMDPASLRL